MSVFHNRRWDTDITTLRGVLDGGLLGDIWRFDSRFDLDQPQTLEAGPDGGLLRDLGSHLVDQALWLLGPARAVIGEPGLAGASRGTHRRRLRHHHHARRRGALARLGEQGESNSNPANCACSALWAVTCHRRPMCKRRPSSPGCVPSTT